MLILDLMMPKMDGIEVLKKIRTIDSDIAVVIFTAHPNLDSAVASMKLDAVDYIKKPFNVDEFREVLARVMKKKGLARTPEEQLHKIIGDTIRNHAQGEGADTQADEPPHRPQHLAPVTDRTRRIEPLDLELVQDRDRARFEDSGLVREQLSGSGRRVSSTQKALAPLALRRSSLRRAVLRARAT